jgi:hypothetical protein
MRQSYNFLIESDLSGHRLLLNGQKIATFATLDAAEAEATKIAKQAVPGATLKFDMAFGWTLTDLEIRGATLEWDNDHPTQSPIGRGSVCG